MMQHVIKLCVSCMLRKLFKIMYKSNVDGAYLIIINVITSHTVLCQEEDHDWEICENYIDLYRKYNILMCAIEMYVEL